MDREIPLQIGICSIHVQAEVTCKIEEGSAFCTVSADSKTW